MKLSFIIPFLAFFAAPVCIIVAEAQGVERPGVIFGPPIGWFVYDLARFSLGFFIGWMIGRLFRDNEYAARLKNALKDKPEATKEDGDDWYSGLPEGHALMDDPVDEYPLVRRN